MMTNNVNSSSTTSVTLDPLTSPNIEQTTPAENVVETTQQVTTASTTAKQVKSSTTGKREEKIPIERIQETTEVPIQTDWYTTNRKESKEYIRCSPWQH